MANSRKLSVFQAVLLIIVSRITIAYTYLPIINTPPANQDMWLVVIASAFYVFIMSLPLLYLGNKFKGFSLLQYTEIIIGKHLGRMIGILLVVYFIFLDVMFLVLNMGFLGSSVMPETPLVVNMIFLIIPCIYSAYKGLIIHGRISEIFTPLILGTIILFTLLNYNNMDLAVFLPVLKGSDFKSFSFGAWSAATLFYEIVIIGLIAPDIEGENSFNKVFFYSTAIFTVFYVILVVSAFSVLGVKQAQHSNFPYYTTIQQISLLGFIERVESINMIGWFIGVFINFSLQLYLVSEILAQVFHTKSNRIFIIPVAIAIFTIAATTNITKGVVFTKILSHKFFPYINTTFIFFIPMILWILFLIRRKAIAPEKG